MKNVTTYFKGIFLSTLTFVSFITSLYLSIIFFLIVMIEQAISGKENKVLKDDFSSLIQKISDLPQSLFHKEEKKEMDLSGKLS